VILDEPTNHLDIDSRAALIAALNDYQGAVLLVSHDRYLIESCAERLWLVADGAVRPFDGDLDDYGRFVLTNADAEAQPPRRLKDASGSRAGQRRAAAEKRIEVAPLRRRVIEAEQTIERLSREIARIDAALAGPGLFARDPAAAAALSKARAEAVAALGRAENDWLAASTELEAAMA
jgi:ATP-binding cassette subfamily F protein 3